MRRFLLKLILICIVALSLSIGIHLGANRTNVASDDYVRDRVYKLHSAHGSCTGVDIRAPSGKVYMLSAGHCADLADADGIISAENEQGVSVPVRVLQVDGEHDLMILTPADIKSIEVADRVRFHEHVHSMTHGHGMPTYRTDGEMLKNETLEFPMFQVVDNATLAKCSSVPNQHVAFSLRDGFLCIVRLTCTMSSAQIVPGSSGGPVVNVGGQLVGVASNTDGVISGLVPLEDIHNLLKGR